MTILKLKIVDHDSHEYKLAINLREELLRKPLGLTFSSEELKAEKDHIHIAGFEGDEVITTAVLVPQGHDYKMQRVVVKPTYQSLGLGSQMIKFCENYARTQNIRTIYCHARDSAVNFYLKNNWIAEGDYFDEDTIPHIKMRKVL